LKRVKPIHIKLPNGTIVSTCYAGTIFFDKNLYLTDVLYFPEFSFNLISVPKLTCSLKCQLIFDSDKCVIQDSYSQKMIGAASLDNGLYLLTQPSITLGPTSLNFCTQTCLSLANNKHKNVDCNTWHMRFGHASYAKLVELNKVFPSINVSKSSIPCDICFYAKQKRLPFPNSFTISANTFDIVHMDIWGPLSAPSMLGFKYFLTVVDDKSRFTWLYFLKLKSEASTYIKSFVSMIKTQYNIAVKCIRSDNGPEFLLKSFYNEHGIIHQCSCVSTPQQNGIVERKHQHILGTARALLFQSKLPYIFWAHAVGHAVHIINKLPTPFLSNKSPYQVLHNCLPDIDSLRVFGSLCYATTLQHNRRKLDSRSRKCVYLGFRMGVKGHSLFDLQSREIFISRDVVFFEHIFPYHSKNTQSNASTSHI
jgi:hypothetical protein